MQQPRREARALRLLQRGFCLRCPLCGQGPLFAGWFAMHERCQHCRWRFEREPGYFLGAMYINYGVTVVIALLGYFALEYWAPVSLTMQLVLWVVFGTLFPVVFFRHARGLWLGFDLLCDATPETPNEHDHDP